MSKLKNSSLELYIGRIIDLLLCDVTSDGFAFVDIHVVENPSS